jgi:hypothetical protein
MRESNEYPHHNLVLSIGSMFLSYYYKSNMIRELFFNGVESIEPYPLLMVIIKIEV